MFDSQGTQHVDYRGSDGHIHELWWDGNGWHTNDLTGATGATVAPETPPPTCSTPRAPSTSTTAAATTTSTNSGGDKPHKSVTRPAGDADSGLGHQATDDRGLVSYVLFAVI